jgi:transposase
MVKIKNHENNTKNTRHRRHDISDITWETIEGKLLGRKGSWGRPGNENRLFMNAVFWVLHTGSPWRDLPTDYGNWNTVYRRFCR